jgi:hypothetical protein
MAILTYLQSLGATHLFDFDNRGTLVADDLGNSVDPTNITGGNYTFELEPVCEGVTHSLDVIADTRNNTDGAIFDSRNDINSSNGAGNDTSIFDYNAGVRSVFIWCRQTEIQNPTAIYEQGGGSNNFAFMGGALITWQAADSGQPFLIVQSKSLAQANRSYFLTGIWEHYTQHLGAGNRILFYINGVLQGIFEGTGTDNFPGHGANITCGNSGDSLQSFAGTGLSSQTTDKNCNFLGMCNNVSLTQAQCREIFERTTFAEVTIPAGTVASQQTALDALSTNTYQDVNCAIRIIQATDATDYRLFVDQITFNADVNLEDISVQFVGTGILTLENTNGTVIQYTSTPPEVETTSTTYTGGGSIVVVNNTIRYKTNDTITNSTATKLVFDGSGTTYTVSGGSISEFENVSGNTVTVTLDSSATIPSTILETSGAIVVIAPPIEVNFTNLQAGSQVVVFQAGTQVEIFREDVSGTSSQWSEAYISDIDFDYTIQKAGFLPIRATGFTASNSILSFNVSQIEDRAYQASSGLIFGVDATIDTVLKTFSVSTATTVQNFYSFFIESFISESTLTNTTFPLSTNGPNSFSLNTGYEFDGQASIGFLSRDGLRYVDTSGNVTAIYSAIQSIGEATGLQGEYQQVEGVGVTDAKATGSFDQLIQVFGDATHGNFDYRDHLVLKYQANGFRESRSDVVATYGTLEDQLYIVAMGAQSIDGLVLGNPFVSGVTVTDHGAAPVSWDAGDGLKDYSITIEDSSSNSGDDILRWLNYNLSLDTVFQGKEPFNWPEMVLSTGSGFETSRGVVEGSTGATLKGVRVVRTGGTPHPDFLRFQADDGSYGIPIPQYTAVITNIEPNSRLQLYNVTTASEIFNGIVVTSTYSQDYLEGSSYSVGDTVRVRLTYASGLSAKINHQATVLASTGWSLIADQQDDQVYADFATDGSTITKFTADYVNDEVDLIVSTDFLASELYSWWVYNLSTEQGIREFFGGITAIDAANIKINDNTLSIYLDNTTSVTVKQSDVRRIFRGDSTGQAQYPVKEPTSGGGGIDVDWKQPVIDVSAAIKQALLSQIPQEMCLIKATVVNNNDMPLEAKILLEENEFYAQVVNNFYDSFSSKYTVSDKVLVDSYSKETGVVEWVFPQGATVKFFIKRLGINHVVTIPAQKEASLHDLLS